MIAGEGVDFKWSKNQGDEPVSLPTTKRMSVKLLPPHLIIHLKRFEFDFERLEQVKVNSRFEFPHHLDMKPFTKEGRPDQVKVPQPSPTPSDDAGDAGAAAKAGGDEAKGPEDGHEATPLHPDEYYHYELMGIVIHTGSCHSGHYYSFIKERDPDYDGTGPDTRRWCEFNDASVSPFNPKRIEAECFGGSFSNGVASGSFERSRNAFVLFYDRVPSKRPAANTADPPAASAGAGGGDLTTLKGGIRAGVVAAKMLAAHRARRAATVNRGVIPTDIFSEIWKQNREHWLRRNVCVAGLRVCPWSPPRLVLIVCVCFLLCFAVCCGVCVCVCCHRYDKRYFDFMWRLLSASALESSAAPTEQTYPEGGVLSEADAVAHGGASMQSTLLGMTFVLETLPASSDKDAIPRWAERMARLVSSNVVTSLWLLQRLATDRKALQDTLVGNSKPEARAAIAAIVSAAIATVAPFEREFYPTGGDPSPEIAPEPVVGGAGGAGAGATPSQEATKDTKYIAANRQVVVTMVATLLHTLR